MTNSRVANSASRVNGIDKAFVVWSKTWARYANRVSIAARRESSIERNIAIIEMHERGIKVANIQRRIVSRPDFQNIGKRQIHNIINEAKKHIRFWHSVLRGIRERSYQWFLRHSKGREGKVNFTPETEFRVRNCDCARWVQFQDYNLCPMCGTPSPKEEARAEKRWEEEEAYRRFAFYG